jgi:hypothetical protein
MKLLVLEILSVVGMVETIFLIVGLIYGAIMWTRGIFPALLRLGNGLARRKIVIFATNDNLSSLKELLVDSGLFREKNIFAVTKQGDLGAAEKASLYLAYWPDCGTYMDEILRKKPDQCPLVVYAPRENGPIDNEQMKNMDGHRHTAVTNFRGRLLNDIVTAMITTGYEKK